MDLMLKVFVNAKDGIDLDKLAERLFDFLCDDPDDLFPEITSVSDYGYEVP